MIGKAITQLLDRQDLSIESTMNIMDQIMNGNATNAQIAAFLIAMRAKGESIDEITACARIMRKCCKKLTTKSDVLDIVGTGGDGAHTFNISTISSFVVSAAGVAVAKHGNRSVSSKCGSADVLEALGVQIEVSPEESARILEEIGVCFMFAPYYHTSMKYAAPVRRELGIRTIFNILGPLSNPADANLQLLGVYDENLVEPMAQVLNNLGVKHAMVVHGHDGLDEVSLCASSTICEVQNGVFNSFFLDPRQFGFNLCRQEDLVGGDAKENAHIALQVLGGEKGPKKDIVVLNSALSLYLSYNHKTLRSCIELAEEIIDSGAAMRQLEKFKILSNGGTL